jgi:hypothetical protein
MRSTLMKRIKRILRQPQFQIFLFSLCLVLFSWPVVNVSNAARAKAMFVYLFLAWTVVSFLLYLVTRSLGRSHSERD